MNKFMLNVTEFELINTFSHCQQDVSFWNFSANCTPTLAKSHLKHQVIGPEVHCSHDGIQTASQGMGIWYQKHTNGTRPFIRCGNHMRLVRGNIIVCRPVYHGVPENSSKELTHELQFIPLHLRRNVCSWPEYADLIVWW